jgi:hypothetical protein
MTRRSLLASFFLLPVVRALDLEKMTVWCDGREYVWWEPRAVSAERFRRVRASFAQLADNRIRKRLQG